MKQAALIDAACRAYWGRTWDSMSKDEQIKHRAGIMRAMEFLKKNGWAAPTQVLGVQIRQAANEAYLARLGGLIGKVYEEAAAPIPEDF